MAMIIRVVLKLHDYQVESLRKGARNKRMNMSNYLRGELGFPAEKKGVSSTTPKKRKPGVREGM
jgi:hypothetical protein